mgnify:CR=1 FL=1
MFYLLLYSSVFVLDFYSFCYSSTSILPHLPSFSRAIKSIFSKDWANLSLWTSRNFTTKSNLYPFIDIPNQVNDFIQWTLAFHVCIIQRLLCPLDFPFRMSFIQQCVKLLSKNTVFLIFFLKSFNFSVQSFYVIIRPPCPIVLTEMFFEHSGKLVLFQYILDHNICSDPEDAAPISFRAFLRHRRVGKDVSQKTFYLGTSFPDGLDQVFRCWPAQGSCISFPGNTCDQFRTECMWDFLFSSG